MEQWSWLFQLKKDYIDMFLFFYQKRALVMLSGSLTEIIATHSPLSARKEEKTQRISEISRWQPNVKQRY